MIQEGTRSAEQKIKEAQDLIDAKQIKAEEQLGAENISKMGGLATQFTNSFEDVLFEIRTRTYAEQEQIYIGFLKLIDQQRELIVARKDLATRLKASVRKPVVAIGSEDIDKLPKNVELPKPSIILTEQKSSDNEFAIEQFEVVDKLSFTIIPSKKYNENNSR